MGSFAQSQWPSWAFSSNNNSNNNNDNMADLYSSYQTQYSSYPGFASDSLDAYQSQRNRLMQHQQQMSRVTETKPRLSKEEVEILETEFQKNHKPSSSTKKALAESMRVDNARINNWFQNRRAREKKENNIRQYEAKQRLERGQAGFEDAPRSESCRQRDLVASSAPFPGTFSHSPSEQSLSDHLDQADESTGISQRDEQNLVSPVALPSENFFHELQCVIPSIEDYQEKPTEAIDIASRRNRRPAPLFLSAGRSHSHNPRNSDASRTLSMRRVSSSNGICRVTKSVANQRSSPIFDRSTLQRRSSSFSATLCPSVAPLTPDTPVVLKLEEPADNFAGCSLKYAQYEQAILDSTLTTPPTTPSFSNGLYQGASGYGAVVPEENVVSAVFNDYMLNNNQQMDLLYASQMTQPYLGFMATTDSDSDYTWSELSPSSASV